MDHRTRNLVVVLLLLTPILGCEDDPAVVSTPRYSEIIDSTLAVGVSCTLTVDNFVGAVDLRPGDVGIMQIVATKWAEREADLDQIVIEITELLGGVSIQTDTPVGPHDLSVDLDVTAPPDTRPKLLNGVGSVSYEGRAEGRCHFETGVGGITLILPNDVNVEVQLAVGVGSIQLDFPVDGQVSQRVVNGVIGTGADGHIHAQVGVGNIKLIRQGPGS